jgi:hypothetical protein
MHQLRQLLCFRTTYVSLDAKHSPLAWALLGATVNRRFGFHQVTRETPDLAAFHLEHIAEYKGQVGTVFTFGQDRTLGDDYVVLLNETPYIDDRATGETGIDDVLVERGFAS